jgi:hypothetical protein
VRVLLKHAETVASLAFSLDGKTAATWRKKISGLPCGSPDDQAYLRVPSIPSVAWQP